MVREVERVQNFLTDPKKSAAVFVTLPESLVLNETFEFVIISMCLIPDKFAQRIAQMNGDAGRAWIDALPVVLDKSRSIGGSSCKRHLIYLTTM